VRLLDIEREAREPANRCDPSDTASGSTANGRNPDVGALVRR
jgi:hypothetical protein